MLTIFYIININNSYSLFFFFSSRRRHTRYIGDWSSDVCSSDLFGIGLTITIGILVAGPLTGAALNPARAFGPALAANHWAHHGIYWIGPLAGGFIAGLLYDGLYLKKA